MRGKDVIEFLGLFKELNNSNFKPLEFEEFGNKAEFNAFTVSPKNRPHLIYHYKMYPHLIYSYNFF